MIPTTNKPVHYGYAIEPGFIDCVIQNINRIFGRNPTPIFVEDVIVALNVMGEVRMEDCDKEPADLMGKLDKIIDLLTPKDKQPDTLVNENPFNPVLATEGLIYSICPNCGERLHGDEETHFLRSSSAYICKPRTAIPDDPRKGVVEDVAELRKQRDDLVNENNDLKLIRDDLQNQLRATNESMLHWKDESDLRQKKIDELRKNGLAQQRVIEAKEDLTIKLRGHICKVAKAVAGVKKALEDANIEFKE